MPSPPPPPPALPVARFERLLLAADASALLAAGLPDAAAVARGDYAILTSPPTASSLASQLAHDAASSVGALPPRPSLLAPALRAALAGSTHHLFAVYTAGVALLHAFLRANWAGPDLSPGASAAAPAAHDAAAALLLASDGEDVARPARRLAWLHAARAVLLHPAPELVRCGATLAPWLATRVALAHQAVLSGLSPSLGYDAFTMFACFLGKPVLPARERLAQPGEAVQAVEQSRLVEEEEEDDFLLPAPAAEGADFCDEDSLFVCALDPTDPMDQRLLALAHLELALTRKLYYDGDGALDSLKEACQLENIAFHVSGELGVRMKHQTKSTAQLVARAFERAGDLDPASLSGTEAPQADAVKFPNTTLFTASADQQGIASLPLPKNVAVNDSDVLGYIQLTGENASELTASEKGGEDGSDTEDGHEESHLALGEELQFLSPLRQALALGEASVVRARNASHVLTKEEMAPYVNLVIQNAESPLGTSSVLQIRALMMRMTFERERGRFLERCMSQMEEIGRFVGDPMESETEELRNAAGAERNFWLLASALPPSWELKKELAISFGRIGLVKSAMEIFEKLEYWDELVDCHRLIGNVGAAESLVREQLELLDKAVLEDGLMDEGEEDGPNFMHFGSKGAMHARAARRPRLLCVLGDVTRNKEHFETAWEESGNKYARAKRALGRMCVEAEEWEDAVSHFRQALAVNALFPEVWFTYGCAAIQTGDMQLAANAFTRVVQQTPENGEAWNNLGRVLHELGKEKEALKALTEAAKTKRDSWRIWSNVLMLATELRSSAEIVRAMERLLELKGKDGVKAESIGVAVAEVVRMSSSDDAEDMALVGPVCRKLLKVLGRCTALVSTNPSIWAAYGELHELVPSAGGAQKAFDCRLKQVRSLVAHGEWARDKTQFRHMVIASDALARVALRTGNSLNIRAARLHVASAIGQTSADFKADEAFARLNQVAQSLAAKAGASSGEDAST